MALGDLVTVDFDVDFAAAPSAPFPDLLRFDDSIVSLWKMSGNASLTDELGLNDGTLNGGPALAAGLLDYVTDQCLSFDGVNDYAIVPSSPSLLQAGSWTYEGLVLVPAALTGTFQPLVNKGATRIYLRADGKLECQLSNDQSGTLTVAVATSTTVVEADTPYCVKVCYDAVLDLLLLYVNGRVEAQVAHSAGTELTGAPLVFCGRLSTTAPTFRAAATATDTGAATTSLTCAKPSAPNPVQVGDRMLAEISFRDVAGTITLTAPAGWTLIDRLYVNAIGWSYLYERVVDGTEGASFTWTASAATIFGMGISAWAGVHSVYPYANPVYSFADAASATSHNTRQHLPAADHTMILTLCSLMNTGNLVGAYTVSGSTKMYDVRGTSSPGWGVVGGYQTQVSAAAITGTVTNAQAWTDCVMRMVILNGTGAAVSKAHMQDWAFLSRALSEDDALEHNESRQAGQGPWTSVVSQGQDLTYERGRQYELDKIEAATGATTFSDPSRNVDPTNQDSPYSPNVVPMKKARARLTVGGSTFDGLHHLVEEWPPQWLTPGYTEVKIKTSDAFTALALADVAGTIPAGLSGEQINRLLDKARYPSSLRAIDTGLFIMDEWVLDAEAFALPSIQTIADSELGVFFISAAGVATFHDYAHRWTQARSLTPQAVFTDDPAKILAGTGIPYMNPLPSLDPNHTFNVWEVTTASGEVASNVDAVSAVGNFRRKQKRSTRLRDVSDARTQALALIQETARPGTRLGSITVMPDDVATWQTVLALEISDRVTFEATQFESGSAFVQDCFVEGVTVDLKPGVGTIAFQLSPVSSASFYETVIRRDPVSYYRQNEAA